MLKFVILVAILALHGDFIAVAKPMAMIGDSFQGALYATLAKSMQGNIDRMFYEVSMKPVEAPIVVAPVQGVQTYMSKSQRILRCPVQSLPVVLSRFSTPCGMPFLWLKYEPGTRG